MMGLTNTFFVQNIGYNLNLYKQGIDYGWSGTYYSCNLSLL